MKIPATSSFAVVCLLLVLGSFSSVSGSYPQPDYLEKMRNFMEGERWANFFNSMRAMDLPPSLTIFWPTGEDESMIPDQWALEPDVVLYHIVPGKFSYWQLSRLAAAGERIPTLLPYKSILLTADKSCNVSLNHIQITHPEKFHNGAVLVHGVSTPLNYFLYGDQTIPSEAASPLQKSTGTISPQPSPPPSQPVAPTLKPSPPSTSGAPTPQPLPPYPQHAAPTPQPSPPPSQPVAPTPKPSPPSTSSAPTPQPLPPHSQHAATTPKPSPPSKVNATSAAPTPQPSPPPSQPVAPTPKPSPPSKVKATSAAPTPQPSPPSKLDARSATPTPQPSPPSKLNARSVAPTPQRSPPSELNARSATPAPQPSPLSKIHATSAAPTPQPSPTFHATTAAPAHHPSSA